MAAVSCCELLAPSDLQPLESYGMGKLTMIFVKIYE